MNPCEITVHAQEKKKKTGKRKTGKRGRRIQLNPNAHIVMIPVQKECVYTCVQ